MGVPYFDSILKRECKIRYSRKRNGYGILAMERSSIRDIEIKYTLRQALIDKINDREVYMKGIDYSYYYEGYALYKAEDL